MHQSPLAPSPPPPPQSLVRMDAEPTARSASAQQTRRPASSSGFERAVGRRAFSRTAGSFSARSPFGDDPAGSPASTGNATPSALGIYQAQHTWYRGGATSNRPTTAALPLAPAGFRTNRRCVTSSDGAITLFARRRNGQSVPGIEAIAATMTLPKVPQSPVYSEEKSSTPPLPPRTPVPPSVAAMDAYRTMHPQATIVPAYYSFTPQIFRSIPADSFSNAAASRTRPPSGVNTPLTARPTSGFQPAFGIAAPMAPATSRTIQSARSVTRSQPTPVPDTARTAFSPRRTLLGYESHTIGVRRARLSNRSTDSSDAATLDHPFECAELIGPECAAIAARPDEQLLRKMMAMQHDWEQYALRKRQWTEGVSSAAAAAMLAAVEAADASNPATAAHESEVEMRALRAKLATLHKRNARSIELGFAIHRDSSEASLSAPSDEQPRSQSRPHTRHSTRTPKTARTRQVAFAGPAAEEETAPPATLHWTLMDAAAVAALCEHDDAVANSKRQPPAAHTLDHGPRDVDSITTVQSLWRRKQACRQVALQRVLVTDTRHAYTPDELDSSRSGTASPIKSALAGDSSNASLRDMPVRRPSRAMSTSASGKSMSSLVAVPIKKTRKRQPTTHAEAAPVVLSPAAQLRSDLRQSLQGQAALIKEMLLANAKKDAIFARHHDLHFTARRLAQHQAMMAGSVSGMGLHRGRILPMTTSMDPEDLDDEMEAELNAIGLGTGLPDDGTSIDSALARNDSDAELRLYQEAMAADDIIPAIALASFDLSGEHMASDNLAGGISTHLARWMTSVGAGPGVDASLVNSASEMVGVQPLEPLPVTPEDLELEELERKNDALLAAAMREVHFSHREEESMRLRSITDELRSIFDTEDAITIVQSLARGKRDRALVRQLRASLPAPPVPEAQEPEPPAISREPSVPTSPDVFRLPTLLQAEYEQIRECLLIMQTFSGSPVVLEVVSESASESPVAPLVEVTSFDLDHMAWVCGSGVGAIEWLRNQPAAMIDLIEPSGFSVPLLLDENGMPRVCEILREFSPRSFDCVADLIAALAEEIAARIAVAEEQASDFFAILGRDAPATIPEAATDTTDASGPPIEYVHVRPVRLPFTKEVCDECGDLHDGMVWCATCSLCLCLAQCDDEVHHPATGRHGHKRVAYPIVPKPPIEPESDPAVLSRLVSCEAISPRSAAVSYALSLERTLTSSSPLISPSPPDKARLRELCMLMGAEAFTAAMDGTIPPALAPPTSTA